MKRVFIGLIFFIGIISGCSKKQLIHDPYPDPYADYKNQIIGTWNWRWYFLYDSIYGSKPYENLMQHTGGTYRFTTDSMFKTEIDTSWWQVGGQLETLLDSSYIAFDYTMRSDSLFARNTIDGLDTFIVSVDSTYLSLSLKKYSPGRFTQTQTNAHR
jgi:hypothetical protein